MIFLILIVSACSSSEESKMDSSGGSSKEMSNADFAEKSENTAPEEKTVQNDSKTAAPVPQNRKVIYTADMSVRVKSYQEAVSSIQKTLASLGGYVMESNTYSGEEDQPQEGTLTVKVPQEAFQSFLNTVEKGSIKVENQTVSGQDVTEEYVDLESRLKSKKTVEERLLSFMKEAQKTEDLLKISNDLSAVQEEIEQLTGRINYLNNQTAFATVSIHLSENKINVPGLENENLNTWQKTKQQFMESINTLLSAGSAIIVFTAGNLPVLAVLFLAGFAIWLAVRKRMNRNNPAPPADMGD
ncbi:DUF4349 domain-containing protein [Metabacillus indicus]|uniref:DUF4349 domain-containing protein n=1 Tax=Metabacillus indicus TaxID=246786 RepID=UPI002A0A0D62|nr:DUF4349 domain-containing protein [Metabacillus indicus]MDX8291288.1 DUF4349 domain-containing protein [Metabacillus indicus]